MNLKFLLLFFFIISTPFGGMAQNSENDTLPSFIEELYSDNVDFTHASIRDREVQQKELYLKARTVEIFGTAMYMGILLLESNLAVENNWNEWIYIPCATLLSLASIAGTLLWSAKIESKADKITKTIPEVSDRERNKGNDRIYPLNPTKDVSGSDK